METTKIIVNARQDLKDKLREIMERRGFYSLSEAIRYCISEQHRKEFPAYIEVQRNRKPAKTPQEKAADDEEREATRSAIKEEKTFQHRRDICNALQGQERDGYCFYKTYAIGPGKKVDVYEVQEPFDALTDNLIDYQYRNLLNQTGDVAKVEVLELLNEQNATNS